MAAYMFQKYPEISHSTIYNFAVVFHIIRYFLKK